MPRISKPNLRSKIILCLILFISLISVLMIPASGKTINAQSKDEISSVKIDNLIAKTVNDNHIPGLSAIIIKDNQTILEKGYGQDISPQTQFIIGSVSKSFTALATMQLVEQNKLGLDVPVQEYLPWFTVADKEASEQITIRHLLNHTSGLNEARDPGANNYSPTLIEQIQNMAMAELSTPIGTEYQYNSQNYRLLSLLIEEVSGQTFEDYLEEHIFTPLDMKNSTAKIEETSDLAQGHGQMFGFPIARDEKFQIAGIGSGYIISTAEDMGRYLRMLLNHGSSGGITIISEKSWQEMITPPEGIDSIYGMGWIKNQINNQEIIYHGGSLTNYTSFAAILPEENAAFVFLCNQNGVIPMFTVFNSLKKNLIEFLANGSILSENSYRWLYWLLRLLLFVTAGLQVFRIGKQLKYIKEIDQKNFQEKWLVIVLNLLIPLALLSIPILAKVFLDASTASWKDAYRMIPDLVIWLMMLIISNLIIGMMKLYVGVKCKNQ